MESGEGLSRSLAPTAGAGASGVGRCGQERKTAVPHSLEQASAHL